MSRLDEIEEYVSKATPGPWEFKSESEYGVVGRVDSPHEPVCGIYWWDEDDADGMAHDDGQFIANARTDMPLLLAVAKAAYAQHERLKAAGFDLSNWPPYKALEALENKAIDNR